MTRHRIYKPKPWHTHPKWEERILVACFIICLVFVAWALGQCFQEGVFHG